MSPVKVFNCEVCTLDDYLSEKHLDRIDFIKLDVEGAELPALLGGLRTLQKFHPKIHVEFFREWTEAFGYTAKDLISCLQSLGYKHFYLDNFLLLHSPIEQLETGVKSQNIICSVTALNK